MPKRKKSKASPAKTETKLPEIEEVQEGVELPLSVDDMKQEHDPDNMSGAESLPISANDMYVRGKIAELEARIDAVAASVVNLERRLDEYLEAATEEALEEEDDEEDEEEGPSSDPNYNEYVVTEDGETLPQIAKKILSNPGHFNEIAALNYDRYPSLRTNPMYTEKGWRLRLP